jgi:hypothetical protein
VHKRTDSRLQKCKDHLTPREDSDDGVIDMLFIVGLVIVFVAVLIIRRMPVPAGVIAAPYGWMSEQWLVEHHAKRESLLVCRNRAGGGEVLSEG